MISKIGRIENVDKKTFSGHKLTAERTTAGLKINSGQTNSDVAKAGINGSDDNV